MEIKLNRALWNHKKDDKLSTDDNRAQWAINKGYAVKVDPIKRKKKIDPAVKNLKNKSCK